MVGISILSFAALNTLAVNKKDVYISMLIELPVNYETINSNQGSRLRTPAFVPTTASQHIRKHCGDTASGHQSIRGSQEENPGL